MQYSTISFIGAVLIGLAAALPEYHSPGDAVSLEARACASNASCIRSCCGAKSDCSYRIWNCDYSKCGCTGPGCSYFTCMCDCRRI
ncbi:hypothetical protein MN608_11534 [Microdochium nivale]|nr:hypothetical protein MN608_11534 [Microdochium nivale]